MTSFNAIIITGTDTDKFLQGQLTINVNKLSDTRLPCAISDLKGRVQFGLWAKRMHDGVELVVSSDCAEALKTHIKKYGAFSKITLTDPQPIYPTIIDGAPDFSTDDSLADVDAWTRLSIEQGNYWIVAQSQGLYQPQELRLHQRAGVDYDKGCYLGQEIIARLWFKAAPKAWLHRVAVSNADTPNIGDKVGQVHIVNAISTEQGYQALVIGSPQAVSELGTVLPLPDGLNDGVARP